MKKPKETTLAASIHVVAYIVLKGGRPCSLVNVSGLHRGGVLLPQAGDISPVISFLKKRDARRAVGRTQRCVDNLKGSMLEEWAWNKCPNLFATGEYAVVPVGRQA